MGDEGLNLTAAPSNLASEHRALWEEQGGTVSPTSGEDADRERIHAVGVVEKTGRGARRFVCP